MLLYIGRRLATTIRKRLFGGIISQDIVFFDGNSSGQLTSRLTNDVSFMVSPIQSMLGTLISNSILLVGGFGLCFYTSWRLSVLAFSTVGPIIHVTQVYAQWSQWLNRRLVCGFVSVVLYWLRGVCIVWRVLYNISVWFFNNYSSSMR